MNTYWQKRDSAKKYIATGLRQVLVDSYCGLPVIVLRNAACKMRADNKTWVKEALKLFECEDFKLSWQTSFEYILNESGVAIVSDFTIIVEGT